MELPVSANVGCGRRGRGALFHQRVPDDQHAAQHDQRDRRRADLFVGDDSVPRRVGGRSGDREFFTSPRRLMRLLSAGLRGAGRRQCGLRGGTEHGGVAGGPLFAGAGGRPAVRPEFRGDQRGAAALPVEPRCGDGVCDVGRRCVARPRARRCFRAVRRVAVGVRLAGHAEHGDGGAGTGRAVRGQL